MASQKKYRVKIDRETGVSNQSQLTGRELLKLVDKTPERYRLHQQLHGGRVEVIGADDIVDVSHPGVERFKTLPLDQTEGSAPPATYRIKIDGQMVALDRPQLTGRELLQIVGKTPERYRLHQQHHGGRVEVIGPDDIVDLSRPGVERFVTLPLDQTEGEASAPRPQARRQFRLPAEDEQFLDVNGYDWETLVERGKQWLLVHGFPVPAGYTVARVIVAVFIPPGYSDAALDMAWFNPALVRADGHPIKQTNASETIASLVFQRWSRHRTPQNPWRASVDNVSTHLGLVSHWLEREIP